MGSCPQLCFGKEDDHRSVIGAAGLKAAGWKGMTEAHQCPTDFSEGELNEQPPVGVMFV